MQIEPFFTGGNWILVVEANKVSTCRECTVKSHWTFDNTWSATKPPMTFAKRESAMVYLQLRREYMQTAPFE